MTGHGQWLRPVQGPGPGQRQRQGQLLSEAVTPSAAAPGSSPAQGNETGWCSLRPAQREDKQRLVKLVLKKDSLVVADYDAQHRRTATRCIF